MKGELEGVLVRIFISETDQYKGQSLVDWIVQAAHKHGAKAALSYTSSSGFVLDRNIATRKILDLWINMPVVIELIGDEITVDKLLPVLAEGIGDGIILKEKIGMTVCTVN